MGNERGNLSISSENIFPIIKKWMYSDQDIFVREMVSNGCDAITKLKKLEIMGEYQFEEGQTFSIQVIANPKNKTLKFIDNGIGMTADEVKEYINQIAFSGAEAFLNEYKDKTSEDQIIGHFGLGFYSAFMVSDKVTIETLSYKDGSKAVYWECDGGTEFEMRDSDKETVGTEITLYLNEDCYEYSNEYRVKEVLRKYCSFMPEEIYFVNTDDLTGAKALEKEKEEEQKLKADMEKAGIGDTSELGKGDDSDAADSEKSIDETADGEPKADNGENDSENTDEITDGETDEKEPEGPKPINDTHPLWTKHPNDCSDEEYKEFYKKVFNDFRDPLFWIHLNMDYPYNIKGILYFPRLQNKYEPVEGVIKLYNNQVFVADNVKEVIPEFLMLLKGVIDCPDLPLNVSRSALQNDGFVKVISEYITKKVADKLSGMCKTKRDEYEKYWDDIDPFIKYGCIKDSKFTEKMNDYVLFKDMEDKYKTMPELLAEQEDEKADTIYYITDHEAQGQYISMFKEEGQNAVYMEHIIDSAFISKLEGENDKIHFKRIDTALSDTFKNDTSEDEQKELSERSESLQTKIRELTGKETLNVEIQNLKNQDIASMLTVSEEDKRMEDMMLHMGMGNIDLNQYKKPGTLILNNNNDLVKKVLENEDGENTNIILEQLYDLARLGNEPLDADSMAKFIARSNKIMKLLEI